MSASAYHLPVIDDAEAPVRPRTRGECVDGPRPCPFASCEHHAIHGMMFGQQALALDDDAVLAALEALPASCTLDVADREGATLEEVGLIFGVTRERIRRIESGAIKRSLSKVKHLADVIVEEPEPELRPSRCGPVPASEARSWTPAPAQHAHLPGPADVADGEGQMWCGHMGVALRAKLCVQRHSARGKGSAMSGAAGQTYPTYPDCARCPDGAGVAARLGSAASTAPMVAPSAPAPINWFGDDEGAVAANDSDSDAPEGRTEDDVAKKATKAMARTAKDVTKANAARITAPAAGACCTAPTCTEPPQGYRESLDPVFRTLCKRHRLLAQGERTKRLCTAQEAVDIILRRAAAHAVGETDLEGAREIPEAARHDLHAEEVREQDAAADAHSLAADHARAELAAAQHDVAHWKESYTQLAAGVTQELTGETGMLATSDACAQIRALRTSLDAARERIDELEGQQLADARATELRQVQEERDDILSRLAVTRLEITRLTGERESLRAERDKAYAQRRADLARIVTALVDESSQTWGVDDIVHGIEMVWRYAREDKTPWLRLERIYKAVHPASAGCWWTIERDTRPNAESARAWVAEIHDRDDVEGVDPVRAGHGPTPEAAIDELVKRVEEMAHDARETITAALESSR